MAQLAAKVDADARKLGCTIPFADLLIGAAALHFGYAVGTRNLRHFQMIPNLAIVQLLDRAPFPPYSASTAVPGLLPKQP
jgi:predicted nucleic acid-binding protein